MTVKRLKELLSDLPDDCIVKFEYDGPDAYVECDIHGMLVSKHNFSILLVGERTYDSAPESD
jgi:hypothetical protein